MLSISPAGVVESLWSFPDDTVYGLLWQNGNLWVATGLEGKLYRWADQQMLLEKDVDERQIVAVLPGDPGPAFATTNAAALFRVTAGTERAGTYTSAALDAEQVARFGTFSWQGDLPPGGAVALLVPQRRQRRARPHLVLLDRAARRPGDPADRRCPGAASCSGGPSCERATMRSPRIYETELSYRQENLSPKIGGVQVLDPGQILVPANFNPASQVFEPAHPNRDGIFTSLTPAADDDSGGRSKTALEARLPDAALDGGRSQRRRSGLRSLLPSGLHGRRQGGGLARGGERSQGRPLQLRRHVAARRDLPLPSPGLRPAVERSRRRPGGRTGERPGGDRPHAPRAA